MLLRIWQWGGWSSHNCQTLCWIQLKHASKDLSSTYILYKYETIVYWIWATLRCNNLRLAYNKRYTQNNTKEKLRFAFTIVKDKHSLICQGHSQNTANPRAHHGHTMLPRRNYTATLHFGMVRCFTVTKKHWIRVNVTPYWTSSASYSPVKKGKPAENVCGT